MNVRREIEIDSEINNRKIISYVESFFSKYWIVWSVYFIIPQLIVDIYYQSMGYLFSYTGYHWLLHIFLFLAGILIGKFYTSLTTKVISLPLLVLEGYMYFRFLLPEILYFNPYFYILNIIVAIPMGLQALWTLITIIYKIIYLISIPFLVIFNSRKDKLSVINRIKPNLKNIQAIKTSHKTQIALGSCLMLLIILPISNVGFGDTLTIHDEGNTINRVGFWGVLPQGIDVANYANPEAIEELEMLREINAFCMVQIHASYLEDPTTNALFTDMMYLYKSYDIEIVLNANPITYWYNETSEEWVTWGDYVTYHHTETINHTIDLIMSWMNNESFSNVIGLSLDIEGPVNSDKLNESFSISYEAYKAGLFSYSEKLKEFKTAFPGNETMQISMEGIMWDAFDSDFDLCVAQKTVDFELDFDQYGYMTYHLTNDSRRSSYSYYTKMVLGEKLHGEKFQPWIGWIGENDTMEDPIFYQHVVEHLKIAKNFGDEIIIGYLPPFVSDNHDVAMKRLNMLKEIISEPYEDFTIRINLKEWDETIFPTYWMMSGDLLQDLMYGQRISNGIMIPWFNLVQTAAWITASILLYRKSTIRNEKYSNIKNRK